MNGFRTLPRPGVEAELANVTDYRLTVICAPAGFGKHTALQGWAEQLQGEGARVEWIDVETAGDLPAAFDCASAPEDDCIVIIDGFEAVTETQRARNLVRSALKSARIRCAVFVTTVVPEFGAIGLVPFMNCYVVGQEAFVFDRREIEQLYDAAGTPAGERRTSFLLDQCGGWPLFVFAEFSSARKRLSSRYLHEQRNAYLEGLVSDIPEDERAFLEAVCTLDSMKARLCDELLGGTFGPGEVAELIGRLERRGLMEETRRGWWRLYPPLRSYLVERTGVQRSLDARMRNRTAYRWYRQQGMLEEAARQMAMMVEESDPLSLTRDLLPSNVRLDDDLARKVAARPLPWISSSPNACVIIALAYLFTGDGASALLWVDKLKTALAAVEDSALRASFTGCVPYLEQKAYAHLCESERSIEIGEALLTSPSAPKSTAEGFVRHALGEALENQGRLEEARLQYEAALAIVAGVSSPMLLAYVFYDLAWLLMRMGRASEAEVKCREALQACPSHLPPYVGLRCLAELLKVERGTPADLSFVDEGYGDLVSAVNNPDLYLDLNVLQARSAFMSGDSQGALSTVVSALSEVRGQEIPRGAIIPALAERLTLALSRGSASEAQAIHSRIEGLTSEKAPMSRLYLCASQARIALYNGNAAAATEAAENMKSLALGTGAARFELQSLVLQAAAAALCEDNANAEHCLREALRCCRATGAVYPFLEQRMLLRPHLFALVSSRKLNYADLRQAKRILVAFERAGEHSSDAGGVAGDGILTRKESEVLFLLSLGYSRDEMADALVVSVNTVKTHLTQLYAKLGVHSRNSAVEEARSLGILPG